MLCNEKRCSFQAEQGVKFCFCHRGLNSVKKRLSTARENRDKKMIASLLMKREDLNAKLLTKKRKHKKRTKKRKRSRSRSATPSTASEDETNPSVASPPTSFDKYVSDHPNPLVRTAFKTRMATTIERVAEVKQEFSQFHQTSAMCLYTPLNDIKTTFQRLLFEYHQTSKICKLLAIPAADGKFANLPLEFWTKEIRGLLGQEILFCADQISSPALFAILQGYPPEKVPLLDPLELAAFYSPSFFQPLLFLAAEIRKDRKNNANFTAFTEAAEAYLHSVGQEVSSFGLRANVLPYAVVKPFGDFRPKEEILPATLQANDVKYILDMYKTFGEAGSASDGLLSLLKTVALTANLGAVAAGLATMENLPTLVPEKDPVFLAGRYTVPPSLKLLETLVWRPLLLDQARACISHRLTVATSGTVLVKVMAGGETVFCLAESVLLSNLKLSSFGSLFKKGIEEDLCSYYLKQSTAFQRKAIVSPISEDVDKTMQEPSSLPLVGVRHKWLYRK